MHQENKFPVVNLRRFRCNLQQEVRRQLESFRVDRVNRIHEVREHGQQFIANIRNSVNSFKHYYQSTYKSRLGERAKICADNASVRQMQVQNIREVVFNIRSSNTAERVRIRNIMSDMVPG